MASLPKEVADGVFWLQLSIANIYFVRSGSGWTLIDTAVPGRGQQIHSAAEAIFGTAKPPTAILLTHAHGDHLGSALELSRLWNLPISVPPGEMRFVDGTTKYPEPDLSVGGFMALMARFVKLAPFDLEGAAQAFDTQAAPPGLPDWECIETPGHSPGHVSFFRRSDGTLIAGDAVLTVNLNSLLDILRKRQRISPPPAPFTCDWPAAKKSVARLAALEPKVLAAGHGVPFSGGDVASRLRDLAEHFPIPTQGRYANGL